MEREVNETAQLPVPTMVEDFPVPKELERAAQLFPVRPILPVEARPETVSKIATAISAVMAEVGHVAKGGTNEFHRYKYATMENVLQKVTPLMAKHGLAVIQTEKSRSWFDGERVIAVTYAFTIMHSSGEVWPERPEQSGMCRCRDSKGGFDDKSLNKCHTSARKYFLLALFQIPTGEEDDNDKGDRPPTRPIRRPTSNDMNDAIPEHDRETGEILSPRPASQQSAADGGAAHQPAPGTDAAPAIPQEESQQLIYYDTMLRDAAESGDPAKLKATWDLEIPHQFKVTLKAALDKRHKPRCNAIAADLLR